MKIKMPRKKLPKCDVCKKAVREGKETFFKTQFLCKVCFNRQRQTAITKRNFEKNHGIPMPISAQSYFTLTCRNS